MSLLFKRQTIAQAVLGELPPEDLVRLRVHLKKCPDCRAHYDALSLVAGTAAKGQKREGELERARLLQTLGMAGAAPEAAPRKRARVSRGWIIPLGLAPVAAGVAFLAITRATPKSNDDDVTWRGNERAAAREDILAAERASLSLRFYARRKEGATPGPVRLVGELPASGELRASRADQLQITYAGLTEPRYLLLIGVDGAGNLHRYYPVTGDPTPLEPSRDSRLLGPPVDLKATHPVGPVTLYAVVSKQPTDAATAEAELRRRKAAPDERRGTAALGGVLWIDP